MAYTYDFKTDAPLPDETIANSRQIIQDGKSAIHERINSMCPIGGISMHMTETVPYGWLECDGAAVNRTTYADLFAVIGTTYGVGNGTTTFNLPDLRGYFPRAQDGGAYRAKDCGVVFAKRVSVTSGSKNILLTISTGIDKYVVAGDRVFGPGIPSGAVVVSALSASIVIDKNATATATTDVTIHRASKCVYASVGDASGTGATLTILGGNPGQLSPIIPSMMGFQDWIKVGAVVVASDVFPVGAKVVSATYYAGSIADYVFDQAATGTSGYVEMNNDVLGSKQTHALAIHTHSTPSFGDGNYDFYSGGYSYRYSITNSNGSINETRPKNVAVMYIIRAVGL